MGLTGTGSRASASAVLDRRLIEDPGDAPIRGGARGSSEDPELVMHDEDLELLGPIASAAFATCDDQSGADADREVEEGNISRS